MFDKLYFKINSKTCEMSGFLITGSSGFLGKHLVNSIEKNHKVLGLSNDVQYTNQKIFLIYN